MTASDRWHGGLRLARIRWLHSGVSPPFCGAGRVRPGGLITAHACTGLSIAPNDKLRYSERSTRLFVVCQAQVDALVAAEERQDGCMALLHALTNHPSQSRRGGPRWRPTI